MIVFSSYEKVNVIIHIVIYILSYIGALSVIFKVLTTATGPLPDDDMGAKVGAIVGIVMVSTFGMLIGVTMSIKFMEWIASG